MNSHVITSNSLPPSVSQAYLTNRSNLWRRLKHERDVSSIVIVSEASKSVDWFASKLRIIFGRSVAIALCRDPRLISKLREAVSSDLIIVDLDQSQFWAVESFLRQVQCIGASGRVVMFSDGLLVERRQQLLRLGVAKIVHKDDADTSSIIEAVLGLL